MPPPEEEEEMRPKSVVVLNPPSAPRAHTSRRRTHDQTVSSTAVV